MLLTKAYLFFARYKFECTQVEIDRALPIFCSEVDFASIKVLILKFEVNNCFITCACFGYANTMSMDRDGYLPSVAPYDLPIAACCGKTTTIIDFVILEREF